MRPSREQTPEPIGSILQKCLQKYELDSRFKAEQLSGKWEELVGTTIALHSRPTHLSNETLFVAVDSPVWLTNLQFMKDTLLRKIKKDFNINNLSEIRFSVSPLLPSPSPLPQGERVI